MPPAPAPPRALILPPKLLPRGHQSRSSSCPGMPPAHRPSACAGCWTAGTSSGFSLPLCVRLASQRAGTGSLALRWPWGDAGRPGRLVVPSGVGVPGLQVRLRAVPQHGILPALTFQDGHVDLRQGLVLGVGEALVGWLAAANAAGPRGQPLLGTAGFLLPCGPGEGRKQSTTGSYGWGPGPFAVPGLPWLQKTWPRGPLTWQHGAGTVPPRGLSANAGQGWG